jgi:hypothetical protein
VVGPRRLPCPLPRSIEGAKLFVGYQIMDLLIIPTSPDALSLLARKFSDGWLLRTSGIWCLI